MAPVFTPVKFKEKKKRGKRSKPPVLGQKLDALAGVSVNGSATPDVNPRAKSPVSGNQLENIQHLESELWDAADNLRANSKLTAGEYCMPVLGVIFLPHATNRYNEALREIKADQASGKKPKRPLRAADFKKRRALMLPEEARYDELLKLPKGTDLGAALIKAMDAVERDFAPLKDQLPKDYTKFENTLLEDLLRVFDSETLRTATGDIEQHKSTARLPLARLTRFYKLGA